jgi:Fungalysin metallopeptidase (M36)/Fungalysin/Thermolysin Propeptide Motif
MRVPAVLVVAISSTAALTFGGVAQAGDRECGKQRPRAGDDTALVRDCGAVPAALDTREAARRALDRLDGELGAQAGDLRIADVNRSPGGREVRFQQSFGGVPVFDGQVVVSLGDGNAIDMALSAAAAAGPADLEPSLDATDALAIAANEVPGSDDTRVPSRAELVVYPLDHAPVLAWQVTVATSDPPHDWNLMIDADTGARVATWDAIKEVTGTGLVFSPNPVQRTGNTGLMDGSDGNTAALDAARSSVSLDRLAPSIDTLKGDFADVTTVLAGSTLPYTPGSAHDAGRNYAFQRSDDRFEEANVYHALTEAQKLIQSLGFTAANNRSVAADVHYYAADNSFYSPFPSGDLSLHFGDGGVDDAEDGDIVLHEYGHSIQDDQVPGWAPGSGDTEQGAIGEGFGDLFAGMFYMGTGNPAYEASVRRYCIGEWDAVSYNPVSGNPGSGCLRWINGVDESSGNDIGAYPGTPDEVHDDGRYWSAAMTCVFEGMGANLTARNNLLRLVIDSHTRLVPTTANTAFEDQIASMLVADTNLLGGANQTLIKNCAQQRNLATFGGGGGGGGDTTVPETAITSGPRDKTRKRRAKFSFAATEASSFQCGLDGAAFKPCTSPKTVTVKRGKHRFAVRATDASGNTDPTPATDSWKVKKRHRRH